MKTVMMLTMAMPMEKEEKEEEEEEREIVLSCRHTTDMSEDTKQHANAERK